MYAVKSDKSSENLSTYNNINRQIQAKRKYLSSPITYAYTFISGTCLYRSFSCSGNFLFVRVVYSRHSSLLALRSPLLVLAMSWYIA